MTTYLRRSLFYIFLFTALVYSCQSEDQIYNDINISVPPVINSNVSNSIEASLSYSNNVAISKGAFFDFTVVNSEHHIAFIDIIKYQGVWYIAFRFSDDHVAKEFGHIIICKSEDLKSWKSEQVFVQNGYDLRDPKFIIKNDILYTYFNSTTISPYGAIRNDYISKYDMNKGTWENSIKINKNTLEKSWFWRLTKYNDTVYTMAYKGGMPLKLYKSANLEDFVGGYALDIPGRVSESTIRFKNDSAFALIRRENEEAFLGVSSLDNITDWKLSTLPWISMGGPNFVFYKEKLLITGRVNGKTTLFSYSLDSKIIKEIRRLPGGMKETGYCGMYVEDNLLYLAYYTGIENGFSIPFTIVNLDLVVK